VNLGGLINYNGPDGIAGTPDDDTSYNAYNLDGFYAGGSHPDGVANEEHFGLVAGDRSPKSAFTAFKIAYGGTPKIVLTKNVDQTAAPSGSVVMYSIQYQNTGLGDASHFVVSDIVPAGGIVVAGSITSGGILSNGVIQWALGNVPSVVSGELSFKVQVP
jgi:uncharacterized repeat protein (TIGR01451 family)